MKKQLITEASFENWLISRGFSEITPSGRKSTVYSYVNSVNKVCSYEGFVLVELANQIDSIVEEYSLGGSKELFGQESHATVINALKQFQEFVNQD